jgi:26S proteasome regulatory subunit T5
LLDVEPEEEDNEGGNIDLDGQVKGKCAVIKTSTRQVSDIIYSHIYGICY